MTDAKPKPKKHVGPARKRRQAIRLAASATQPSRGREREPRVRTFRHWTPARLSAAEVQADGGVMSLAADLVEFMLSDARIKAVLDARTDALLGRKVSFETGLGRGRKKAVKSLETDEDWWVAFPETSLKALQSWALLLGVGVAEIEWIERGKRVVPRIHVLHPRHLRWDHDKQTWMLMLDGGNEVAIAGGDGKYIVYTPYGESRPWAFGAWRALSRFVVGKAYALEYWSFYNERHGTGVLKVTGFKGSADERDDLAEELQNIGHNTGVVLEEGQELTLVESMAPGTWQSFLALVTAADNAAAVTLLGQNLTTDVTGGSQAAATVHAGVALSKVRADAETLSTCLHDQALGWYGEYNWGNAEMAPWPVWDTEAIGDQQTRATVLQQFGQALATLKGAGINVDADALADDFGVPMLKPPPTPDPALVPPAPAPAPAPAPPN